VVVGHRRDDLLPLLTSAGVDVVFNPEFERGMFSSVRAGIGRLAADCRAFFVLPVDIPLVRPATIRCLLERFDERRLAVAYPCFRNRRGHPPLIARRLAAPILESEGGGGLRGLLARWEDAALDVAVADRHVLQDADRPDELAALQAAWPRRHIPDAAECQAVLDACCPEADPICRHGRTVARVALTLTDALRRAGQDVDGDLIRAAACLHDLARDEPDCARVGAERLRGMGFAPVADIVAQHHDLVLDLEGPVQAAEVVFLADKLVVGERLVDLETRFRRALDRCGASSGARDGIRRRRAQARRVQERIEACTGRSLAHILRSAVDHRYRWRAGTAGGL